MRPKSPEQRLEFLADGGAHLGGSDERVALLADVAGPKAPAEDGGDRLVQLVGEVDQPKE